MGKEVLNIQNLRRQQLEVDQEKTENQHMIDTLSMASLMSSRLSVPTW